jgi:hypothetical protein
MEVQGNCFLWLLALKELRTTNRNLAFNVAAINVVSELLKLVLFSFRYALFKDLP